MTIETRLFIAGRWQDGESTVENRSPSDVTDLIGDFAQASTAQLDEALAAARAAQPLWWAAGIQKRHDVLMAIGTELMARAAEIGAMIAREEGKPAAEGKGEVYRAGQFFTYYAAETLRNQGDLAESVRPGIEIDVRREPVGVVAIVSPWNFPVATPAWKIAPALAFGNAVVWKPANATPASAIMLTEIIAKQDIPAGLFNLVTGAGRTVGQRLIESRGVDAISFTGSVPVGRGIAASAMANMTKVQMEMGSKNPMIVMDDADLDLAVAHSSGAAFGGT
ncbi:MAG: aldehyde dehydrogenase family protein, partial [Albidovulum sp.]